MASTYLQYIPQVAAFSWPVYVSVLEALAIEKPYQVSFSSMTSWNVEVLLGSGKNNPWCAWGGIQSLTISFHYAYKNSKLYMTFINRANAYGKAIVHPANATQIYSISMKHGTLLVSHWFKTDIHPCVGNINWIQSQRYFWKPPPSILSIPWQIILIQSSNKMTS